MDIDLNSFVGKFVGPRKVTEVVISEHRTHQGSSVVRVSYAGGFSELLPVKTLVLVATIAETDFNGLRQKKFLAMIPEILQVVAEFDIKSYEVDALFRDCANTLEQTYNRALNFVWTHDDSKFIVGVDPVADFTLMEAQNILSSIPPREEEAKTADEPVATEETAA